MAEAPARCTRCAQRIVPNQVGGWFTPGLGHYGALCPDGIHLHTVALETETAVTVTLTDGKTVSGMLLASPYCGAGDVHLKSAQLGSGAPCMFFAHHVRSVRAA